MVRKEEEKKKNNKKITGLTWLHNSSSISLIIPKYLAIKHGMDKPGTVVFEDCEDGIKIRPLKLR